MIILESFFTLVFFVFPFWLVDQWLPSIFPTVVEISLTTGLIAGVLLLLRPLLQKHYRAKWMYWVWLLVAVRLVLPFNLALPKAPIQIPQSSLTVYRHDMLRTNPGNAEYFLASPEDRARIYATEIASVAVGEEPAWKQKQDSYHAVLSISQIAALVWGVGFCAVLLWEGVSYARFRRRVRRWKSPLEDERFEALKAELGVKKLTLARCSAISSPMVTGFIHPTLLLPETDAPEAVLRHELVHAKRRDLWYKLLLVFARAVHWFNPLVWLMERQASQDLELSCDEAVVAGRDESFRAGYGRAILDAVDCGEGKERAPLTTYFHGGKKAMLERLQSIVNTKGKRRGAIALVLVLALAVSASAVCTISAPSQKVDGGSYRLNVPADTTVTLTEEMPEGFNTSYYRAEFFRDGEGIGRADMRYIPGYADMTDIDRETALRENLHLPEQFTCTSAAAPNGLSGLLAQTGYVDHWFFPLSGGVVLKLSFNYGPPNDDLFVRWFTRAEATASLSTLMVGSIPTPNPKGNFTLTVDFTDDEAVWYLWDTSRSPKLLGTANVPAKYRIWAEPLWSEDGKWAAVPSGDGGLRWNYRIFGIGKEGFTQDFPVTLDAMLSRNYTPVPDSMELRAMKFVDSFGGYPALALSYSLLDTEGNLQSGTLNYNCMPPEVSAALTGYTPTTDISQNTPLVPTVWQAGGHSFSLLLTEGSAVSAPDAEGVRTFTGPNGEYLGKIYKVKKEDARNQSYRPGNQTLYSAWLDGTGNLCYQLEICETDLPLYVSNRMLDNLTMDGKAIDFYYENQIAK